MILQQDYYDGASTIDLLSMYQAVSLVHVCKHFAFFIIIICRKCESRF